MRIENIICDQEQTIIRNIDQNIVCKITYTEQDIPVVSIKGKGRITDIVIFYNRSVTVITQ